jgi:hypothetical protein
MGGIEGSVSTPCAGGSERMSCEGRARAAVVETSSKSATGSAAVRR